MLGEVFDVEAARRVLVHGQGLVLEACALADQVVDLLVVDFEVAAHQVVVFVRAEVHRLEQVLQGVDDDAFFLGHLQLHIPRTGVPDPFKGPEGGNRPSFLPVEPLQRLVVSSFAAHHRVSFAAASLPVGENRPVVAVQRGPDHSLGHSLVDKQVGVFGSKAIV